MIRLVTRILHASASFLYRHKTTIRTLCFTLGIWTVTVKYHCRSSPIRNSLRSSAGIDETLGAAAALIDKSLLLRAETSVATRPLYQMLETVRAFAALKLAEAGERDDAVEGLVRYCALEASFAAAGLIGAAQAEWFNRVRDDLENYRRALSWLIEQGRPAEASDIAWALMLFWLVRLRSGPRVNGTTQYAHDLSQPSIIVM